MRLDVIAVTAVFLVILCLMYRRNGRAVQRARAEMFEDCVRLMASHRVVQDGMAFPRLTGEYRGYRVRVEAVVDQVCFRTLPSLWLLVTVEGELPHRGALDLLVRPRNTEFFSHLWSLPEALAIPNGWPQHAVLRTDRPDALPPFAALDAHVQAIFSDEKAKELVVTPRGVRVVYQLAQAARDRYLVFRELRFQETRVPPSLFAGLADRAIAVHQTLAATPEAAGGNP